MSKATPTDCEIRMTLPATLEAAEEFFVELRRQTQPRLAASQSFAAELLARELLTNAVVHGCQSDPNQTVRCRFRLKGGRMTLAVDDSGQGFDWRAARDRMAEAEDSSGRGMEILKGYCSQVRFNNKGNAVTILKRCG
jgi:serine/threonine-protein kinase RsbW